MSDDPEPADQLAALLESLQDAVIGTDLRGIITSWNNGAERLFGFTSDETIGQPIASICTPTDEGTEILRLIERGERIRDKDTIRRGKDGRNIPVSLTITPVRSSTGEVVGTLRIARNTDEQHRAERLARRLAAIVQSSDDAIISKDLNGIVTSWNPGAERMFGYTSIEMVGRSIRTIIPQDRQGEEDQVLAQVRSGDKVDHFETVRQRKDGRTIPISLTVSPIRDANGVIVGASKIARDIGDRIAAETELARLLTLAQTHAALMQRLNEVGTVVASTLDRNTIVQAVTDAATRGIGAEFGAFFHNENDGSSGPHYRPYALSGISKDLFAKLPNPRATDLFAPTFRGESIVRLDDASQDPRYGRNAPYHGVPVGHPPVRSYLAVPVKSRAGDVLGGLFFAHSQTGRFGEEHERLVSGISAWASVALENSRLYLTLQDTSRLKDEFLATLSHELRTPLNAILGYARMIRSGIVPQDKQARAVDTIERNATSLAQIVEDVLDVSRIISGKMRLAVQPVNVGDVVGNAVETVVPAANAKGIRLETFVSPSLGPVSGDPERVQQIIWNLLSNAVKFTGRGGTVHIRVEASDTQVEITVSDTGIGIPPSFLPHIFERFRQADSGTTRERGGLGLGLGIARQLVELHGGMIEATSPGEGQGSTFIVRLPLLVTQTERFAAGRPPSQTPASAHAVMVPNLRGVRVLAVDDDRDALGMVREILEATGAQVAVADSASAALESIDIVRPDVLVADLSMPRMDGFELIAQVRQSPDPAIRAVPAAALTAYTRSEDRARALKCGFQMHLAKPIDPAELMAAIASLVKRGVSERA